MTDITKCSGEGCPVKEKCYRFTAVPGIVQSMFRKPPFEIKHGKFTCTMYWGESADLLFEQLKSIMSDKKTKSTNSGVKHTKPTGRTGRKN